MEAYHVDMAGPAGQQPDPTHEAAYSRIRRVIQGNKAFIDALVASPPSKLDGNWSVGFIKKHADVATLRELWRQDKEFRTYLRNRMKPQFGTPYTEALIRIFLV
jgi:hypothetical protein